jgi:peptidoglycan/LPS O-acetylase OafA/YrhL
MGKEITYRSDIDGLRAVAVLSVLAYHMWPGWIRGGFVGVDIFFVISGFLISSILYKELESGRFSIVDFYVRRIRRIYPALTLVLAFVTAAGWFLLMPSDFVALGKQIVGGSTFSANFVLWWHSGYFTPNSDQEPLLHLWSLGVEEQYYLIFPLICLIFYRAKSRWKLATVFVAIAIASMVINVAFVARYSAASYFLPFSRLWELFLGAGLSLAHRRPDQASEKGSLFPQWSSATGFVGLVMLAAAIFGINESDPFPGWWALLPTVGAALVIAAGPSSWVNRHILSMKPAVFVGLISYPLYLWHWPILSFMRTSRWLWGNTISLHAMKGSIVISWFVLAYLTYRFVEMPIRRVKERRARRKGALWLLGCVSTAGACGILIIATGGFTVRFPSSIVAMDHDYATDASKAYREGTCFLRSDQSPSAFSDKCVDPAEGHAAEPLVLVWGDSHAADLLPGFRALQPQSGVRLAQYTASLCAPIVGLPGRERPTCLGVNNAVLDHVKSLKPDVVVLSANWEYLDLNHNPAAVEKLRQTIKSVKSAGVQRIALIGQVPLWTSDVRHLVINGLYLNPSEPVPQRLPRSLVMAHDDALLMAMTHAEGVVYVPVFDQLCDETSCIVTTSPTWKGLVTYDGAHFTEQGSALVVTRIWPIILHGRA